jgi:hypothetical protein
MKKIGLFTLLILAIALCTFAFTAAAAPPPVSIHPRVDHAIEALRVARDHMDHAEGEFHGHRAKTIEHIDAAIHEAEICQGEP